MLLACIAGLVVATSGASCGAGDDGGGGNFDVSANADQLAGPTPVVSRFTAKASNARGDVIYRWRFDDGTTSEEQNPTHTFPRAGYYTVILDAHDEDGNNDRQTFLVGAWPKRQWERAQEAKFTPEYARAAQRVQQRRTDARHAQIRARLRERARAQIQG
jgi:PKD domain